MADEPRGRKVRLIAPSPRGFVLVALQIDRGIGPFYPWDSGRKSRVLSGLMLVAQALNKRLEVRETVLFKALMVPPGLAGVFAAMGKSVSARYDVVLLITTDHPGSARALVADKAFRADLHDSLEASRAQLVLAASNTRRIAPVDHARDGVFGFTFFAAARAAQALAGWEHSARWFRQATGRDNATLLLPEDAQARWTMIDHCRWDRRADVLPKLLFRHAFRDEVLIPLAAARTLAMPILYRLA